jgi:hypothetical protein
MGSPRPRLPYTLPPRGREPAPSSSFASSSQGYPEGDLCVPEWIFAVAELGRDPSAIDALLGAVDSLTRQPGFAEVKAIVEVTRELNRVVADHRRRNGPTPRFGLR